MNHDAANNDRVPDPVEDLHHPAKKPSEPAKKRNVDEDDTARDDDEHGGTERDTMTPGRPR